jgi:Protein of unknown function (DUF1588)/Protein of unknown function (DUF1592)/Protein of unknown function (DUF1585)/Cytochrome C oxidase, cbb3-type, subunit III
MNKRFLIICLLVVNVGLSAVEDGAQLVDRYCLSCHGEKKQKGKVRFDALSSLKGDARADLLNAMQEQVFMEQMPPEDEPQPSEAERGQLMEWLAKELRPFGPSKLEDKLRQPAYGNTINHEKLFSGAYSTQPGFTYDRRWLISEYIFDNRFATILGISTPAKSFKIDAGLTNPFLLPSGDGVRYYANEVLGGGHLLTMMGNAKNAANKIITSSYKRSNAPTTTDAIAIIMKAEWTHKRTMVSRETFLRTFDNRIMKEVFQDQHEALLPQFVRVSLPPAIPNAQEVRSFDLAKPGNDEFEAMKLTILVHDDKSKSLPELLEACERDWFYSGVSATFILKRLIFLQNYMERYRTLFPRITTPTYKALAPSEMELIGASLRKFRKAGDTFNVVIDRCLEQWQADFIKSQENAGAPTDAELASLVNQMHGLIFERAPTSSEFEQYLGEAREIFRNGKREQSISDLIQGMLLQSKFAYRFEFGTGQADQYGRRMMSPYDASYALSYALTETAPDKELSAAAKNGRLNTKEDYQREITRMLQRRDQRYIVDRVIHHPNHQSITNLPIAKMRFFRDFFGYPNLTPIFKDAKRFGQAEYDVAKKRLVIEADQLLEHILVSDKRVFEQLLTTDKFYVLHNGNNDKMAQEANKAKVINDYFKGKDWKKYTIADLEKIDADLKRIGLEVRARHAPYDIKRFLLSVSMISDLYAAGQTNAPPFLREIGNTEWGGASVVRFFNLELNKWDYPTTQPAPVAHRKGMLTHPAWLIAHAKNTETDPIRRGRWVREKLLAGFIPDVPLTVDAVLPEDPHKTLRQRLDAKTTEAYCWTCHQHMNPLGVTFEMYDDFGRFRKDEQLEYPEHLITKTFDKGNLYFDTRDIYKTLPVDARGHLTGTGDKNLDGPVVDALDLIDRLGRSVRVRQSIIRHAFRFFFGRNEMLSDSKTLIDADRAYVESGGSFDAVIVSLLTSDSFLYRKPSEN